MLQWSLANSYGIQRDDVGQVWHAGHVNDVLELDDGTIVVAADDGGVWHISTVGDASALSHGWDNPDVLCLALGPGGPFHVFAGCREYNGKGALWVVTDPLAADPLSAWHKVLIPDEIRSVFRIVVLPGVQRVVIASQRGPWWSPFPPAADPLAYHWTQVAIDGAMFGGTVWTDIAEGPGESVVAAIPGKGLFFWTPDDLQMQRAALPDGVQILGRTSLASCKADRRSVYAVTGDNGIDHLLFSGDGGRTWQSLANNQVIGQPPGRTVADQAGDSGWYNNCIAVSPVEARVVVLGWRTGPFISQDSGATWEQYDDRNPNLHGDLHVIKFGAGGAGLYVGSDGGVVRADVTAGVHYQPNQPLLQGFRSDYNHRLATLQFGGWPTHSLWATFSVNNQFAAGGLQDNGNVYSRWRERSPWRQAAYSDGQLTLLTSASELLYDNSGDRPLPTLASWNDARVRMEEIDVVPVREANGDIIPNVNDPNKPIDPNAVKGLGSPKELFVEVVPAPLLQSQDNLRFLIRAVAGAGRMVYGLFDDDHTNTHMHWEHWEQFGDGVPLDPPDFITAVGSYDGQIIFAGTNSGRIFRIDPTIGDQSLMGSRNVARVTRILVDASARPAIRGFACAGNTILQLIGGSTLGPGGGWNVLGPVNPAGDPLFDIAVDWTADPPRLFAATDTRVFTSRDGRHWDDVSRGLPEVPHCAGLQLAGGQIFLSTFGRSMWYASLGNTDAAPALAVFGANPPRLYVAVKTPDQRIFVNSAVENQPFDEGWQEVQGGGQTDAAPALAVFGANPPRLYVAIKGLDGHVYVNSAVENQPFDEGWQQVQGDPNIRTDAAPAATVFGANSPRLYVAIKTPDQRIFVNSAVEKQPFDEGWQEVQGGGRTDAAPALAVFGANPLRLYVAIKGLDGHVYVNSAVENQPFDEGWQQV